MSSRNTFNNLEDEVNTYIEKDVYQTESLDWWKDNKKVYFYIN